MYRSFDAYDQFPIEKSALTPVVPTSNRSFKYSQYCNRAFPMRPSSPMSRKYVKKLQV